MVEGTTRTVPRAPGGVHNLLLVTLWSQVLLLAALGLIVGEPAPTVGLATVSLMAIAIAAMLVRDDMVSAVAVSIGLIACAVVFVGFAGGAGVSNLYFLVMIAAVALYRSWLPLVMATGLSVVYELAVGFFTDQFTMTTAAAYAGFTIVLAVVMSRGWRRDSDSTADRGAVARLSLSFEAAPIGMAVLKPSGDFIQVNRALADLLSGDAAELIGTNIRRIVHSDDMSEVGAAWERIGNDADHSAGLWVRCVTTQGTSIWTRMSLSLVPWTREHPAMVVLQLEDVSRSHAEQRRLEDLIAGKDRFVATIGDEIREPLGMLIDLASDPELEEIRKQAREAASIVDDLVASANAGSGSVRVMALPIDADALCRDVIGLVPDTDGVTLDVSADIIWADPGLTRQILFGLVSNAVRYGGPNVSVKVAHSGPDTIVQVGDDGPEIPDADRERIFNSDLRHGQPATRPVAVGLSLTVGRHLARQMDGEMSYRRTTNGRNVYELRLPSEELGSGYAPDRGGLDISA